MVKGTGFKRFSAVLVIAFLLTIATPAAMTFAAEDNQNDEEIILVVEDVNEEVNEDVNNEEQVAEEVEATENEEAVEEVDLEEEAAEEAVEEEPVNEPVNEEELESNEEENQAVDENSNENSENNDGKLSIYVKGVKISSDVEPFIDSNNRTQVPFRAIGEALGAKVDWVAGLQQVIVSNDESTVVMIIGDKNYYVNSATLQMDTAPIIKDSRTFIPLRHWEKH
ncbi:hypothetical protein N752_19285 [Desulforamulus aquiferis]|nr:copper amine oxidase N-terminal domain-containing protein [Desulforamulus aquiferis]RYD03552.1 hypothetical protein N752_19285 [Desulforamulus aquiferis]